MSQDETRAAPRVAARVRVDVAHAGNYLISHSRNLSADGMYICTDAPPPEGALLQLVFSLGQLHEIVVGARVIWVARPGGAAEPGMGVQFLAPPPALADTILELVHRVAVLADDAGDLAGGRSLSPAN